MRIKEGEITTNKSDFLEIKFPTKHSISVHINGRSIRFEEPRDESFFKMYYSLADRIDIDQNIWVTIVSISNELSDWMTEEDALPMINKLMRSPFVYIETDNGKTYYGDEIGAKNFIGTLTNNKKEE